LEKWNPKLQTSFFEELGKDWYVYDVHGRLFTFLFNEDPFEPLMRRGWMTIRRDFKLKGHNFIYLRYFRNNTFLVEVLSGTTPLCFPTWHSKSIGFRRAAAFRVSLTHDPCQQEELVEYLYCF